MCRVLAEKYGYRAKVNSMGTMLYRSACERDDGIFVKMDEKQNTYGLKDWEREPVEIRESR